MTKALRLILSVVLVLCVARGTAATQATGVSPFAGVWEGAIRVAGTTLAIHVTFTQVLGGLVGTIDVPQQGARGLQLTALQINGQAIHFELNAGSLATFQGALADKVISGSFAQGGLVGEFSLSPAKPVPVLSQAANSEELLVANGNVTLAGTLSLPVGAGPFPAVVLITGSGPQDRDEEVAGFKVFATIAADLTRHGIAVYRYDDRGVGKSTGNLANSTAADFAADALAIVARLKTRPGLDAQRIGLLGHSEGASVAALAASQSRDVAFVVLLAPPGLRGDELLRQQAADVARDSGANGDAVLKIVAAHRKVTEAALAGKSSDDLASPVKELIGAQYDALPAQQRLAVGNRDSFVEVRYRQAAVQIASPWMRFTLSFDPATALRQVTCPVFALFGSLDTQVPSVQNEPRLRSSLAANRTVTVKTYPGANHLFQQAKTGQLGEYAVLDKAFVPGLLDDIASWISATPRP